MRGVWQRNRNYCPCSCDCARAKEAGMVVVIRDGIISKVVVLLARSCYNDHENSI